MGVRRSVRGAVGALLFTLAAVLVAPEVDASRALASGAANASAPSYLETRIGASEIEGRDLVGALGSLSAEERSGYAVSSGGSAAGEHLRVLVHNANAGNSARTLTEALDEAVALAGAAEEVGKVAARVGAARRAANAAARAAGLSRAARWARKAARYIDVGGRRAVLRGVRQAGSLSKAKDFLKTNRDAQGLFRHLSGVGAMTRGQVGDAGERIASRWLRRQGYSDILALQNRSGNGIDIIARNSWGRTVVFEVKTGRGQIGGLSGRQRSMYKFLQNVLTEVAGSTGGTGRYRNVGIVQQARARRLLKRLSDPGDLSGNVVGIDLVNKILRVSPWPR